MIRPHTKWCLKCWSCSTVKRQRDQKKLQTEKEIRGHSVRKIKAVNHEWPTTKTMKVEYKLLHRKVWTLVIGEDIW